MKKLIAVIAVIVACLFWWSCNDGMSSARNRDGDTVKKDRSKRTSVDSAAYTDFTIEKNNANAVKLEDAMFALNNGTFKNGNSVIKVKSHEQTVEISSDSGTFNDKENCQIYGKFAVEVKAASSDCLYMRKDPRREGFLMVDGVMFRDGAVPELAVCLPLYGYSRNRIEVSPVMDGFIVMPSGTYWKQ